MGGLRARPGQFVLFKRNKIWYYYTYDEYGKRHPFSTGKTRKQDAFDVCADLMNSKSLLQTDRSNHFKTVRTLDQLSEGFWVYETSPIVQRRLKRGGTYGRDTCLHNGQSYTKHIAPYFGSKLLSEITAAEIEYWLLSLPEEHEISNKTANNAYDVFKMMMQYAVDCDLISSSPVSKVRPLIDNSIRYNAFSSEQVRAILAEPWDNNLAYAACYLASRTGMRMGEIRALTAEQIHEDYILVNASWSDKNGRKCTKSGYDRMIPINKELYLILQPFMPPEGGLLFSLNGKKPVKSDYIRSRLKEKMESLHIDYVKERLVFHSFRHYVNTKLLAAGLSGEKIRAIIGHESEEMTQHYAHLSLRDVQEFRELQLVM